MPPTAPARRAAAAAGTLVAALVLAGCADDPEPSGDADAPTASAPAPSAPSLTSSSGPSSPGAGSPDASGGAAGPARPRVSGTVASGLEVPWGLDFLPDGSALVTERDSARVLHLTPDGGGADGWRTREVGRVADASAGAEGGLLGLAVSPDFADDRQVFLYVSTAEDNRVVRAELAGGRLGEPEPVLTGIPTGAIHDGGRLAFGPDGHLYASTGEVGQAELAQDESSLAGKILRITPEGEPAPGNPDPRSPVWTLGHRNVQGLAWDDAGTMWASEFGASTWDELNRIEEGGNYGWPRVEGRAADNPGVDAGGLVDPARVWSTDEASPSGLAFAEGSLWLGALRGTRLWQVPVPGGGASGTTSGTGQPRGHFVGDYGRVRTVVTAPDGSLWMTTSNRDGRGTPADDDDRILRVTLQR
ncbi:PQQ-dependent sugar dehydrogenase [Nocardioides solisilvae]|uniref:PQQ-dependent sugar dehydrogenase n=1 Tax=Nocardioides solisilvae TaxID=1542435 RepID=UPI000D74D433|nr:PQQ-dependent sugar dehydrogenase [Nocardioides solisilvae]